MYSKPCPSRTDRHPIHLPSVPRHAPAFPRPATPPVADVPLTDEPEVRPEARPSTAQPSRPFAGLGVRETLFGLLVVFTWFNLFFGGIHMPTASYRMQLAGHVDPKAAEAIATTTGPVTPEVKKEVAEKVAKASTLSLGHLVFYWFFILAFWTITNIGVLSCLAAMIGMLAHRIQVGSTTGPPALTQYMSAVMRGFGIYALFLAGLLIADPGAFRLPTQGQYINLAATISIVSFCAGHDSQMFARLLGRVKRFTENAPED